MVIYRGWDRLVTLLQVRKILLRVREPRRFQVFFQDDETGGRVRKERCIYLSFLLIL